MTADHPVAASAAWRAALARAWPLLALLLALAVRSWSLDHFSIWQDEGLSLFRAGEPWPALLRGDIPLGRAVTHDVHPPLYFALLKVWLGLVGSGTWPAKAFSLLAGLPAVALVWALSRRLAGRGAAHAAATLAALSPIYLWYSQEIRSYTLVVTAGALAMYALARALGGDDARRRVARGDASPSTIGRGGVDRRLAGRGGPPDAWRWTVLAASSSLLLVWTHYLGFCLVAAEAAIVAGWLARRVAGRERGPVADNPGGRLIAAPGGTQADTRPGSAATRSRWLNPTGAPVLVLTVITLVTIVAALPLFPFALQRLGLGAERDQHFVPLPVMIEDVVRGFGLGFTVEAAAPLWQAATWLFGGMILVGMAVLASDKERRRGAVFLAAYLWLPVAALFAITLEKPIYLGVYHLLVASPAYYVLTGAGLAAIVARLDVALAGLGAGRGREPRGPVRRAALSAAATLLPAAAMVASDLNFYAHGDYAKDDLRSLAAYVDANAEDGDVLAVSHPVLALALRALVRRVPVVAVPDFDAGGGPEAKPAAALLAPLLAQHTRLWFMTPADELLAWLKVNALAVDQATFHGRTIPVRVDAFERRRTVDDPDFPARAGRTVEVGGLELLGWSADPAPLIAGRAGRLRLAWQVTADGLPDIKLSVRLLDAAGNNVADGDREPFGGLAPTSRWPVGEITYAPADFTVEAWAPPGSYRLAIQAYDPATGQAWPAGGPADLGEVKVARPAVPIPWRDIALGTRLDLSGAGWRVFGADLPPAEASAGEPLALAVYLAAERDQPAGAGVVAELVDGLGRVVGRAEASLRAASALPSQGGGRPAPPAEGPTGSQARADSPLSNDGGAALTGDLRRASLPLVLPPAAGRYALRMRLVREDGSPAWLTGSVGVVRQAAWLADVHAVGRRGETELPPSATRLDQAVGDYVRLAGYELGGGFAPGASTPITLFWQATSPVPTAYHVTVQLLPAGGMDESARDAADKGAAAGADERPAGPPVAQSDGAPAGGTRPATGWAPGDVVADPHILALPGDLPAGRYWLVAALYDPARPAAPRPAVRQGGQDRDYVLLRAIGVGAPQ